MVRNSPLELDVVGAFLTLSGGGLYVIFFAEAIERTHACELGIACSRLSIFSSLIIIRRSPILEDAWCCTVPALSRILRKTHCELHERITIDDHRVYIQYNF